MQLGLDFRPSLFLLVVVMWYSSAGTVKKETSTYGLDPAYLDVFSKRAIYSPACGCIPRYVNPCFRGLPIRGANGFPAFCNYQQPGACPANYFCHIGGTPSTTTCCSIISSDPCSQPLVNGRGTTRLQRYYYEVASHDCKPFIYFGLGGNQNSFLTYDACKQKCNAWQSVCPFGSDVYVEPGKRAPLYCTAQNRCPVDYWCHVGTDKESTMCCSAMGDPCVMPRVDGQGTTSLTRYFYDAENYQCQSFLYRGTMGNQNNFLSKQDCEMVCPDKNPCEKPNKPLRSGTSGVMKCQATVPNSCPGTAFCHPGADESTTVCCPSSGDPCGKPKSVGSGTSQLQRWYYNGQMDECVPFLYTGLGGNANNFVSKGLCESKCPGLRGFCPHGKPLLVGSTPQVCSVETLCQQNYVCHINTARSLSICCPDPVAFCYLPVIPGTCREQITRFRYQPSTDTCVPFTWSGCEWNMNNFPSLDTCTKICCNEQNRTAPAQQAFGFPGR